VLWLTSSCAASLQVAVVVVFIASEESTKIQDVGVDMLVKEGKLDHLKNGPVFWCDSADSQPCIGTAAAIQWTIKANGYLFHSGLPHKGINGAHAPAVLWWPERWVIDAPCPLVASHGASIRWLLALCLSALSRGHARARGGARGGGGYCGRASPALELGSEAVAELQKRFYADFPAHEQVRAGGRFQQCLELGGCRSRGERRGGGGWGRR
jgi:hypothetical protein